MERQECEERKNPKNPLKTLSQCNPDEPDRMGTSVEKGAQTGKTDRCRITLQRTKKRNREITAGSERNRKEWKAEKDREKFNITEKRSPYLIENWDAYKRASRS